MHCKNQTVFQGERVKLPSKYGEFDLIPFQEKLSGIEHIVLVKGDFISNTPVLTRIHSACATGDLFGSLRCDCGEQLTQAMKMIERNGNGIIVYLQQEGRGIGLMNKMKAYKLQEEGMDTVEANLHLGFAPDEREYKVAVEILSFFNVNKVALLTNNPDKILGLEQNGIEVVNRIPLIMQSNQFNMSYLETKENRMGHLLCKDKLKNQHHDN